MAAVVPAREAWSAAHGSLRRRRRLIVVGLTTALVAASLAASALGALHIPVSHLAAALAQCLGVYTGTSVAPVERAALFAIRLPRVALGIGAGATLGLAGAALQALFRNPLADPGLIGVSGGAAFGAVGWIVFGASAPSWMHGSLGTPLAAFTTGVVAVAGVYAIASRGSQRDVGTLLLAGVAVNALTAAGVGYLSYLGSDAQLRALTFWLLGGLGGATWGQIWPLLLVMAAAGLGLLSLRRSYDVLALGERSAGHLGLRVEFAQRATLGCVALGVGASVALTGIIGFVGLVAPHLVRLLGGSAHRFVLPVSAIVGALLLVVADLLARLLVSPAELPVGIVTSALGAPFFIALLRRRVARVPG